MEICSFCKKEFDDLPYFCKFCGKGFCIDHNLPEAHFCTGLEEWKKVNLGEKKKEGKKTLEYEFRGDVPIGYYPKILSIKNEQQAREKALFYLNKKYGSGVRGFESFNVEFKKPNIWEINGTIILRKLLLKKLIKPFKMKLNAVDETLIEFNIEK